MKYLVFQSKDGKNLQVVQGYVPPGQFKAAVEKALKASS